MPFERNTTRREREGLPFTCPSRRSIWSFSTGAFGRDAEVRVM